MNTLLQDAKLNASWQAVPITGRRALRTRLILKHGNLTKAAERLGKNYQRISHALHGRDTTTHIIAAIQADQHLTNEQVLQLWPQLGEWPKEQRQAG